MWEIKIDREEIQELDKIKAIGSDGVSIRLHLERV